MHSPSQELEQRKEGSGAISRPGLYLVVVLLVLTVIYRVAASHYDFLGNTAPLMAIAFGGAILLGSRFWWVPVALLVISDLVLGLWHGGGGIGGYTVMSISFYLLVSWMGGKIGSRKNVWPAMWCGTLLCSILFYVLANTYSWMMWPGYEKSLAGWWQSQTIGVPGINPPAWMFLRNALMADSIWCAIAGLVFLAERKFSRETGQVAAESV